MKTKRFRRAIAVWLSALLLFACVAATTVALMGRLDSYQVDDSGAIDLMAAPAAANPTVGTTATTATKPTAKPSQGSAFQVEDDNGQVWSTDTRVEIFKVSYVNGEQQITVRSADGDRLIAPGTANSYVFKLKNTGTTPLEYDLELHATVDGTDELPVVARLSRYDGHWLAGDPDTYVGVAEMAMVDDHAILGGGRFNYYTLDWQWPFEGDDGVDTLLGNTREDITLTFEIKTVATITEGPDDGLLIPETGDSTRLSLWIALTVGAFALMMLFLILSLRIRKQEQSETAEETNR